jgi:hypothetical protein
VSAAVPLGAGREQVESWLRSQGIPYRYLPSARDSSDAYFEYIETGELDPADLGGCIAARITDTGREHLVIWDTKITFVLDKNSRTVRHLVTQMGAGF